jgi:hypothetical protein
MLPGLPGLAMPPAWQPHTEKTLVNCHQCGQMVGEKNTQISANNIKVLRILILAISACLLLQIQIEGLR